MARMQRLNWQVREEILRLYRDGERCAVIAARFGIDPSYPTVLAARSNTRLRAPKQARYAMAQGARNRPPNNPEIVERLNGRPTTAMFADREKRLSAPMTLTAIAFGDPPPGCSALDQRKST